MSWNRRSLIRGLAAAGSSGFLAGAAKGPNRHAVEPESECGGAGGGFLLEGHRRDDIRESARLLQPGRRRVSRRPVWRSHRRPQPLPATVETEAVGRRAQLPHVWSRLSQRHQHIRERRQLHARR